MTTEQPNDYKSLASVWNINTPKELTAREMSIQYRMRPRTDVGFFGKVYNAFAGETVTGEIYRSITAPDYAPTGYKATEEDILKYASDLPEESVKRMSKGVSSFAEFLYESDEMRRTNKRRTELYSGGVLGAATGLGLTLVAAGGEAMILAGLASGLGVGPTVGVLGRTLGSFKVPVGAVGAAAEATLAITKAKRIQGSLAALGVVALADIPLEVARYNLDNTLRPRDALIAVGAAAGLGSLVGAWKPHIFLQNLICEFVF